MIPAMTAVSKPNSSPPNAATMVLLTMMPEMVMEAVLVLKAEKMEGVDGLEVQGEGEVGGDEDEDIGTAENGSDVEMDGWLLKLVNLVMNLLLSFFIFYSLL